MSQKITYFINFINIVSQQMSALTDGLLNYLILLMKNFTKLLWFLEVKVTKQLWCNVAYVRQKPINK